MGHNYARDNRKRRLKRKKKYDRLVLLKAIERELFEEQEPLDELIINIRPLEAIRKVYDTLRI